MKELFKENKTIKPEWLEGRKMKSTSGYTLIFAPDHPSSDMHGYVREHRLITELYLDRFLVKGEVIHHINEQKDDNRIENLQLTNHAEHRTLHRKFASQKKLMIEMYKNGMTLREIAKKLKCGRCTVHFYILEDDSEIIRRKRKKG